MIVSTPEPLRLTDLFRCFQGVIPSMVATSDSNGIPNVTYVSQIHFLDDRHVALSCQFFNKTRRNLDENPRACAELYDPVTFDAFRLRLRFLRSEKSGELFEKMKARIDAIASMTGMAGIFRLIAADVFEVERIERVAGFLTGQRPADMSDGVSVDGLRTELRGVQVVSDRINRSESLDALLDGVLETLDTWFGFHHTMLLLPDDATGKLVTVASRGYGESGVGAEVTPGEGVIGTVAQTREVMRFSGLESDLRYARAIRREAISRGGAPPAPEIPIPGLPNAQSALVIPLVLCGRLVGVLAAESEDPMRFGEWHEAYLEVIGNQIALGIDRMLDLERQDEDEPGQAAPAPHPRLAPAPRLRNFVYYKADDAIFVDDEYLVRSVPARILWKLLSEWKERSRTEFTNRELRVDPFLGLPEVRDNLESRLILLRRRLDEKCPDLRIASTGRGRFALEIGALINLQER
jgi:adenylate cyclase